MNMLSFCGIDIIAISACVPRHIVENKIAGKDFFLDESQLQKAIENIGVVERRVSSSSVCSSDLCLAAAEQLLQKTSINRNEIDALIFVSQTPDYRLPATSVILQDKLKLSNQTFAFDVNLGCSGYIYGLSIAFSFANNANVRKVLLLVGDTPTKFVSDKDKTSTMLFGDAGTATLIEKTNSTKSTFFNLFSDGSWHKSLIIKNGGYRNPSNPLSFESVFDDDGNLRNSEQLSMNGGEIFNFTIREVPTSINQLIEFANQKPLDSYQFVFHQANKFMIDFLRKKMKITPESFFVSLEKYGNTSTASIPLTIVLNKDKSNFQNILMAGFGVGLSWGNCIADLSETKILNLIEL